MTDVKMLTLNKDLLFSTDAPKSAELLTTYSSTVDKKMLEHAGSFFAEKTFCGYAVQSADLKKSAKKTILPAGRYFFIQFSAGDSSAGEKAAEKIWLESLWRDIDLDSQVFERTLEEDGKKVVQLFRKVL